MRGVMLQTGSYVQIFWSKWQDNCWYFESHSGFNRANSNFSLVGFLDIQQFGCWAPIFFLDIMVKIFTK